MGGGDYVLSQSDGDGRWGLAESGDGGGDYVLSQGDGRWGLCAESR